MNGKLPELKDAYAIASDAEKVKELVGQVPDPEIPVLTVADLGILRSVEVCLRDDMPFYKITITPTYSGCPANDVIATSIRLVLLQHGISNFEIHTQLSPAWTTSWMTKAAGDKLKAYGIAPPSPNSDYRCPQCNSSNVEAVSEFGSTACKALYKCNNCLEPFDVFKCH